MDLTKIKPQLKWSNAAEILGQLGWQDRTFLEESVDALLGALIDTDDHVLQSVIFALGHGAGARAIEALLSFVE